MESRFAIALTSGWQPVKLSFYQVYLRLRRLISMEEEQNVYTADTSIFLLFLPLHSTHSRGDLNSTVTEHLLYD